MLRSPRREAGLLVVIQFENIFLGLSRFCLSDVLLQIRLCLR